MCSIRPSLVVRVPQEQSLVDQKFITSHAHTQPTLLSSSSSTVNLTINEKVKLKTLRYVAKVYTVHSICTTHMLFKTIFFCIIILKTQYNDENTHKRRHLFGLLCTNSRSLFHSSGGSGSMQLESHPVLSRGRSEHHGLHSLSITANYSWAPVSGGCLLVTLKRERMADCGEEEMFVSLLKMSLEILKDNRHQDLKGFWNVFFSIS